MTGPEKSDAARPPRSAKNQLRVGRLVKAHGLKGALKLELYTDDPEGRFTPGASFTLQVPESSPWHGKSLTVREFRWMNSHPVAFFEGVEDRSAAEELVRAILWIDQDDAEIPTEDDAWYDHQLSGWTSSVTARSSAGSSAWTTFPLRTSSSSACAATARSSCRSSRPSCPRSTSPAAA